MDWGGLSVEVVGAESRLEEADGKKRHYAVFVVRVREGPQQWRVARRYSEFSALQKWAEELIISSSSSSSPSSSSSSFSLPSFPGRLTLLQSDEQTVQQRRPLLDAWLRALVASPLHCGHAVLRSWLLCAEQRLLYRSRTLCPACALVDRSALHFLEAQVVALQRRVRLQSSCPKHGPIDVPYCADAFFVERALAFAAAPVLPRQPADMEDMAQRLLYRDAEPSLPLIMELCLVGPDHRTLLPRAKIEEEFARLQAFHPAGNKFLLRLTPKQCTEMERLNELLLVVQAKVGNMPVLVESTVERLLLLCTLKDSAFRKGNVFPQVKYFLVEGQEQACVDDLKKLLGALASYKGIQVAVTLAFDAAPVLPNVGMVFAALTDVSYAGFVRLITLSPERSPSRLLKSLTPPVVAAEPPRSKGQRKKVSSDKGKEEDDDDSDNPFLAMVVKSRVEAKKSPSQQGSAASGKAGEAAAQSVEAPIDPVAILASLETATGGAIEQSDFFPVSVLTAFEPLLRLLGYGNFSMRAHPLCGFVTVLLPKARGFPLPISRVLDVGRLLAELQPLVPLLRANKSQQLPWNLARKLRGAFQSALTGGDSNPLLQFINAEGAQELQGLLDRSCVVVLHNNMDMAALDLARRCQCGSVTSTPLTENNLAASCTGCL